MPAADRIRVEEFIAATGVAGALPPPGQIEVRLAAGPSPLAAARTFGSEGAQRLPPGRPHVLAVQVAAGSVASKARRGTHLVIALDGSESMRWGNRYEHARRGIAQLASLLEPSDRVTIVRLGAPGLVRRVEIDTNHYKGNFPESASLEGCFAPRASIESLASAAWTELLPRTKLRAHHRHLFSRQLRRSQPVSHVRLNIFPDGGISRLRIYGTVATP